MNENDKEMVVLMVENTVTRVLSNLEEKTRAEAERVAIASQEYTKAAIHLHLKTCLWADDYQKYKIKVASLLVIAAFIGGGMGSNLDKFLKFVGSLMGM